MARTLLEEKRTKACPTCGGTFEYMWDNRMKAEPEYCPEHRNSYRRTLAEKAMTEKILMAVA